MTMKTSLKFKQRRMDRSPRLDTILMIETAVYKHRSDKTITEIWKSLPKKVMWTTYKLVLKYLEYSGKIILEKDKTITWIWNPGIIGRLKKQGLVVK